MAVPAALSIVSAAAAQESAPGPVEIAAPDEDPVVRSLRGIISYTRWPATPFPLRLCVVGETPHLEAILAGVRLPGRAVTARQIAPDPVAVRDCDVLYFGGATGALAAGISQPGMLTVSEQDAACRGGGMFCLRVQPGRVSFQLNLDAVARSGLRIDPKVLIMGRGMGGLQ